MAAGEENITPGQAAGIDTSVLSGVGDTPSPVQLNADDFAGYMPQDLSPAMQESYMAQSRPAPQALSPTDYYPDLNNQINVGNYSGSEVGSLSLFAPGGGLVPLGLMDAREASIHKAALQKALDIERFKNQYKSPITKHTTVQPELDKLYQEGNEKWWNNAMKKSGGDASMAAKLLQSDPNFKAWNQSAQTAAKIEDSVVDRFAKIHDDVKTGKFVYTPELKKAEDDFWSAYHGLGSSPFNKKGHNLNNEWLKLNAEHDFANVANEYIKEAVKQKDAAAGVDVSNPDYIKTIETTKEGFTPETLKTIAASMQQTHFPDMSLPDIEKRINGMYGEMKETKNISVQQKREPQGGNEYNYDNNDFSEEPSSINTKIQLSEKTGGGTRNSSIEATDGLTFKKPIKVVMPVGQNTYFTDQGLVPSKNIGNKDVELGKMIITDVIDAPGQWNDGLPLAKDQVGKYKSRKESMVLGKYTEGAGDKKKEKSFLVPTKDVENSLVKKWNEDKTVDVGIPVDESYRRVEKYNSDNKKLTPSASKANEVKRKTKDGKIAIFDGKTKEFLRYE